ncbi:MAG: glycosyl hydrolase 115 family protein [Pontiellaceae bacterium]|nr:glycosyl hydrolase 115 family protein [Pontiellaceae bacterium]MBN2786251.1 glycosyl hydrolase 115 family protein [Pontiellaceae bacterium]
MNKPAKFGVPLGHVLKSVLFAVAVFGVQQAHAETESTKTIISEVSRRGAFPLVSKSATAELWHDAADYPGVIRAIGDLQADIERVTDRKPHIASTKTSCKRPVIIGTLGHSSLIDALVANGKLGDADLRGKWESYVIATVKDPAPGVKQALVIAGSDRRGTIYGIYELSKQLGVSPWYWWADVPVEKRDEAYVLAGRYASGEPSVKYRGIFINDEDWGLHPWSIHTYEKELGDIGPKTYAAIFELMLRLRANMVAPAMHHRTGAFYQYPESKVVADQYGIIMTTSHCEPLLFNNANHKEWDKARDGEWNYAINKSTILKKLDDRVKEASPYENIYTMGMRGLHDEGMRGDMSDKEKVKILEQVMADQQDILTKYLKKPLVEIPQIFVPYKETLGLYNQNLKVPDNITLVWTDDNYGYIKRLSNQEEQRRGGGSGVYYHASYLGPPHDYLWINTLAPALMYEELSKAYSTGANQYWLLNVGDIKPCELGLQTFLDFAWDVEDYDYDRINRHQTRFLSDIFGEKYEAAFEDLLSTYYRLAWSRKPEYMGWEREWSGKDYDNLADTDYSFENYNDAQQRLADYQRIADMATRISGDLPEAYRPAFFEMVHYPVNAAYQMNRKFLMAQLNHELAAQNSFAEANWAADESQAAFDEIKSLTDQYNNLLDGKWSRMMMVTPGVNAKYQNMPKLVRTEGKDSKAVDVAPQQSKAELSGCTVIDLNAFTKKVDKNGHAVRLIDGLGYDGRVVQLGLATEQTENPEELDGTRVEYEFSGVDSDSVTVTVYSVPTFPLYAGRSTRFGISVDGQTVYVAKNEPPEFSRAWKDQVLRNGAIATAKFSVKKDADKHTLTLTCGDPGIMIQRIVIDWGGLKETYVGPAASLAID